MSDGNPIDYYFEVDGQQCEVKTLTCDAPPSCGCSGALIDAQVFSNGANCCTVDIYATLTDPAQNQGGQCDVKVVIVSNGVTVEHAFDTSLPVNKFLGNRVCDNDTITFYFLIDGVVCEEKTIGC